MVVRHKTNTKLQVVGQSRGIVRKIRYTFCKRLSDEERKYLNPGACVATERISGIGERVHGKKSFPTGTATGKDLSKWSIQLLTGKKRAIKRKAKKEF